jgi:hypothetical protein
MGKLDPTTYTVEPWMAGRFAELEIVPRFLCCSLEHSLSDLHKWVDSVREAAIWHRPFDDETSIGFSLRHIAGSVDRLTTYARGESLTEAQFLGLREEARPGASRLELMDAVTAAFERTAAFAADLDPAALGEVRFVGRKRLETRLGLLLAHIAEHTQRHAGQTILLVKLSRRLAWSG